MIKRYKLPVRRQISTGDTMYHAMTIVNTSFMTYVKVLKE